MHVKYVLAADTEQASAEWRKAIEAHVRFASSAQGMKAYHHVLQARELVRKARRINRLGPDASPKYRSSVEVLQGNRINTEDTDYEPPRRRARDGLFS